MSKKDYQVRVDFRIAVGSAHGPRSSVWRGASNNNEVYLSHSMMGKVEKFSFHRSLKCRRAFHEHTKPSGMDDRAIEKWTRVQTPPTGISYALVAIFPTDTLSTALAPEGKDVLWIGAALPGATTVLEFIFTRDNEDRTRELANSNSRELLSYTVLPNEEAFCVTKTNGRWTGENFVVPGVIDDDKQYVISRDDPQNTGRPARFSTYRQLNNGTVLEAWEYGAYQVPLDAEFSKPMGRLTRTKLLRRQKSKQPK